MKLNLYNTLSRSVEEFNPINDNKVSIYSCGPTVYDYAHIGNLRSFLFADLLQRTMRVVGKYDVKWVMNITDIDDKTIKKINDNSQWTEKIGEKSGNLKKDLKTFTSYYAEKFKADIQMLAIDLDDFYDLPRATDYIDGMKDLILKIYNNGFAYESDGSVYFDVSKWSQSDKYGKLKNIDLKNLKKGVRIDADEYEREDISDFVLWKAVKDNEPSWFLEIDGKNLEGRPGWHLECSTMGHDLLGLPFDIHTGGIDLQFPHHEDEIAQSKSGYGVEPVNFWCHNEFLQVESQKMSKSLGNFYTLRDLLEKGLDPIDIRFAMLSSHYRSKYNFTFADVESAKKSRKRLQDYVYTLFSDTSGENNPDVSDFDDSLFSLLANDLHTPKFLAELFSFINENPAKSLNNNAKEEMLKVLKKFNQIFEILEFEEKKSDIPSDIIDLAEKRLEAKKRKDFKTADLLRDEIKSKGYLIMDKPDGFEIESIE